MNLKKKKCNEFPLAVNWPCLDNRDLTCFCNDHKFDWQFKLDERTFNRRISFKRNNNTYTPDTHKGSQMLAVFLSIQHPYNPQSQSEFPYRFYILYFVRWLATVL